MKPYSNTTMEDTDQNMKTKDIEMQPLLNKEDAGKDAKAKRSSLKEFFLLVALDCLSRFLVAISKICVQALQDRVPAFQLNFYRCFLALCSWLFYLTLKRKWPRIESENIKACALWSFNQAIISISSYISVVYIALSAVETVYLSSNILSSLLVFVLILRRESHWSQVVYIIRTGGIYGYGV